MNGEHLYQMSYVKSLRSSHYFAKMGYEFIAVCTDNYVMVKASIGESKILEQFDES